MIEDKKDNQLTHDLFNIMGYAVYRGVIISKLIGGYEVLNKRVSTTEAVDKVINDTMNDLNNSIINKKQ